MRIISWQYAHSFEMDFESETLPMDYAAIAEFIDGRISDKVISDKPTLFILYCSLRLSIKGKCIGIVFSWC